MTLFERAKPTYIENWPNELCRLSIAQAGVKLDRHHAIALGEHIIELGGSFSSQHFGGILLPRPHSLGPIQEQLDEAISRFPKGCYVRLGSRGPKDSLYPTVWPAMTGADAIQNLTACSERIHDDLLLALHNNYDPWIWCRQWLPIEPKHEFRCFMKDRKLVGISQYNYFKGHIQWIADNDREIRWVIEDMFFPFFSKSSHMPDVVFDVIVRARQGDGYKEWVCKLLEINPFVEMTDACLFDWRKPFDGGFKYL